MQKAAPWVLLVRYNHFPTAGVYFEKYFRKHFNLVCLYVDGFNVMYQLGRRPLGRPGRWLIDKILARHLKHIKSLDIDAVVVIDPVRIPMNFDTLGVPTAYVAIDNGESAMAEQIKRARIFEFDHVFVTQKDWMGRYKEKGCQRVYWLPPAADPDTHRYIRTPEIYDVSFIGSPSASRSPFVLGVRKRLSMYKTFFGAAYLRDMALYYSQSKIVLNKSLFGDLNQRVFEVMSCGRLLLTDVIQNGLGNLFESGSHFVSYSDLDGLEEMVSYYLASPEERGAIATRGQQEVQLKHTYENRVEQIATTLGLKMNVETS